MPQDKELFRFRDDLSYILFDTETEGLNLKYTRPFSIAFIVVENKKIIKEFDLFPFIKDLNVCPGAAKATRFNYEEYKKKSTDASECYNIIKEYLYNPKYYVVGQNLIFYDSYILRNFEDYLGIKGDFSYINRVYDTLALGRAFNLGLKFPTDKENFLSWSYKLCGYKKKGLKANNASMAKQFDIPYDESGAHGALYDVKLSNSIFIKLYNSLDVF